MAALEPHDDIGAFRQPVDNLALTLVAPLGANHYGVGHFETFSKFGPGNRQGHNRATSIYDCLIAEIRSRRGAVTARR